MISEAVGRSSSASAELESRKAYKLVQDLDDAVPQEVPSHMGHSDFCFRFYCKK
jgi:hypothetical protein